MSTMTMVDSSSSSSLPCSSSLSVPLLSLFNAEMDLYGKQLSRRVKQEDNKWDTTTTTTTTQTHRHRNRHNNNNKRHKSSSHSPQQHVNAHEGMDSTTADVYVDVDADGGVTVTADGEVSWCSGEYLVDCVLGCRLSRVRSSMIPKEYREEIRQLQTEMYKELQKQGKNSDGKPLPVSVSVSIPHKSMKRKGNSVTRPKSTKDRWWYKEYLIKWKDWPDEYNEWRPQWDVHIQLIREYEEKEQLTNTHREIHTEKT